MKELQSEAALFEVQVPDFPLVTQCRNENKMLKQLWDYVFLVRYRLCQIIDTDFILTHDQDLCRRMEDNTLEQY